MNAVDFGQKVAEIMLPGVSSGGNSPSVAGLSSSPSLPPITGPLTDDLSGQNSGLNAYRMYDPSNIQPQPRMSDADVAAARAMPPDVITNPGFRDLFHAKGRDAILDQIANSGPVKTVSQFGEDFMHYGYNNPVWRAGRGIGRFADAAFDGKNSDRPLRAGWRAMMGEPDPNGFMARTSRFVDNVYGTAQDIKDIAGEAKKELGPQEGPPVSQAQLDAAKSAPSPTFFQSLASNAQKNPLLYGAAGLGLGGLGIYGLYTMMANRREAARRRKQQLAALGIR